MQDRAPTVSVITATRNRPAMLRRALASVRAQSFADYEMVVADDGSDPEWQAQYQALAEEVGPQLVFFHAREAGAPRSGPGAARNRAMARARGEYIAFLDDDDQWVDPEHLATAVRALQAADADYFFANMQGVRSGVVLIADSFPNSPALVGGPQVLGVTGVCVVSLDAFARTMRHHLVHPNVIVAKRETVQKTRGFHEKVRYAEDYGFCMCLADVAGTILYRAAVVAHLRLPEADSSSLTESDVDHALDGITVPQYIRSTCKRAAIRRCARAREAWAMRELSRILFKEGWHHSAASFAWQALCVFPTVGSAVSLLRVNLLGIMARNR